MVVFRKITSCKRLRNGAFFLLTYQNKCYFCSAKNIKKINMENEIWKDIPQYEGLYQVSNLGKVRSLPRRGTKKHNNGLLRLGFIGAGYLRVNLCKNNKRKTIKVHQLVAMAFLNHTPNGMKIVVDHINEDKTDNRLENIQLISCRENTRRVQTGKGYTSVHKGVHWNKKRSNWSSRINIKGKILYLGDYKSETKAAELYQKASKNIDLYNGDLHEFKKLILL